MLNILEYVGNATISSVNTLLNNEYLKNMREKLIKSGLFYSVGIMNTVFENESVFADITPQEIHGFDTAHPIEKYNILYKILNNVIPKDKKIKIGDTTKNVSNKSNLESYLISTNTNLLGYIKKNANKPLDNISRLLLPFKFSNLSWYINNQLINNIEYISLLEIITLLDAFIEIEGRERFFYYYIQKIKLTGLTMTDIEFILSLIWIIMNIDLEDDYRDIYDYDRTNPTDQQYKLSELKNVFNIIFHIDNAKLTGFNTGLDALSKFGVTDVFLKKIKNSLIEKLSEPYKKKCKEQIYTLTFAQYIAALLLTIKDNTPLAMVELGAFQRIFDDVLYKQPKINNLNMQKQTGGAVIMSSIVTIAVSTLVKPILNFIYDKSIFMLSNIDTFSRIYLDFLYKKNITYNELKKLVKEKNYLDSFIYIIEDDKNTYPHLRALLLTMEFKNILTPNDRKYFIKTLDNKNELFYRQPEINESSLKYAFKSLKFNIETEAFKTFDFKFIITILSIFSGSWGDFIKSYKTINSILSLTYDINTYEYLTYKKNKINIFDSFARLIINAYDSIQNNKKIIKYIRSLILYQIIFTNTYLLIVDTIASRNEITGKIEPSRSNYKDAEQLAEKIAELLYNKNNEFINIFVNSYIYSSHENPIFNNYEIKKICDCINFNHSQNIILEADKYILGEKLGLLKQLSRLSPKESVTTHTKKPNTSHNSNSSFTSAVTNQSSSHSTNNLHDTGNNTKTTENVEQKELLYREKLFHFFKRIFQYNLAMTSFDIENLLEFNIDNTIMICDETRDILDFYSYKPDIYNLFMPTDLTKKINFIEY